MTKIIGLKILVEGGGTATAEIRKLTSSLGSIRLEIQRQIDARKKLNAQRKAGTIGEEQFAKKIVATETRLKGLRSQLNKNQKALLVANGTIKKTTGAFGGLSGSILKAATALGGGIVAFQALKRVIGNIFGVIKDFEQQMAIVAAITGATAEQMDLLSTSAIDLGRSSIFTATEVGSLQESLAKLGFTTEEIINASGGIIDLATAFKIDLGEAATVVAGTLRGFGIDARDTVQVVDLMTESFKTSGLDIEKFKESIKLVAPAARATGRDLQETTALLAVLADNMISGSIAGTQLNRVFIELNKKGIDLDDAINQVKNSSNRLGEATDLVGIRGAKALVIFASQTDKLGELREAYKDSNGEAERAAKITGDTLEGATKRLNSAWEGLILTFDKGDGALSNISRSFVDSLTDLLNGTGLLSEAFTLFGNVANEVARIFFGPLISAFEFVVENIGFLKTALQGIVTFGNLVNETFTTLKNTAIGVGNALSTAFNSIFSLDFDGLGKKISGSFNQAFNEMPDVVSSALDDVLESEKSFIDANNQMPDAVSKALDKVFKAQEILVEKARKLAEEAADAARGLTKEEKARRDKAAVENKKRRDKESKDEEKANKIRIKNEEDSVFQLDTLRAEAIDNEFDRRIALSELRREQNVLDLADTGNKIELEKAINEAAFQDQLEIEKERKEEKKEQDATDKEESDAVDQEKIGKAIAVGQQIADIGLQVAGAITDGVIRRSNERINQADIERDKTIADAKFALDTILDSETSTDEQRIAARIAFDATRETADQKFSATELKERRKQAKAEKALALLSIGVNTATAVMKAIAASVVTGGLPFSAIAAAAGIVQAAIVSSTPLPTFAAGGHTGSGAGIAPDSTGQRPVGVVHANEWVANRTLTSDPITAPIISALEGYQRNGFAHGGFTSPSFESAQAQNTDNSELLQALVSQPTQEIRVINVVTDTTEEQNSVANIQTEAEF